MHMCGRLLCAVEWRYTTAGWHLRHHRDNFGCGDDEGSGFCRKTHLSAAPSMTVQASSPHRLGQAEQGAPEILILPSRPPQPSDFNPSPKPRSSSSQRATGPSAVLWLLQSGPSVPSASEGPSMEPSAHGLRKKDVFPPLLCAGMGWKGRLTRCLNLMKHEYYRAGG